METAPTAPKGGKGAPAKGKASKNTTAKKSPKGPRLPNLLRPESGAPREGGKTAQVLAMLQSKNGATLCEILDKTGWQKHTVRAFHGRSGEEGRL